MSEHSGLTNNEVADIYQSMLNGDKDSLYKLQQVSITAHLPRVTDKYKHAKIKINTEQNTHQHQQDQIIQENPILREDIDLKASSVANIARKKEQMYLNAIKRGAKMGALSKQEGNVLGNFQKQKRWVNSSNKSPQLESKEIKLQPSLNRQQNPSQKISEQYKTNHTADLHLPKKEKIYALPKVPNPRQITKVQSAQVNQSKKNVSLFEPEKPRRQKKKLQKIDFKQMISKSKKERNQFQSKNQQERKAQVDIMEYHRSTKDFLDSIRQKYQLNFSNRRRFLKRHKSEEQYNSHDKHETNNTQKMSPFKANMAHQRHKCNEITEDISVLMTMYNKNNATINKLQRATTNLSFARYLQARGNSVSSISEQEEDEVQPLDAGVKNQYLNLMAHTRQKKWGLVQRTEYEAQRTQSLGESRRRTGNSRLTHATQDKFQNINQQENKMTINQRLKNLLFT